MDYSRAIRLARARLGGRQSELAQATGLDPSYVSLLESGKRTPSLEVVQKISDALQIPRHLFDLLAAEQDDLKVWSPESVNELAINLIELMASSNEDTEDPGDG